MVMEIFITGTFLAKVAKCSFFFQFGEKQKLQNVIVKKDKFFLHPHSVQLSVLTATVINWVIS